MATRGAWKDTGSAFGVRSSAFRVLVLGFWVLVLGSGSRFWVLGSGFWVLGSLNPVRQYKRPGVDATASCVGRTCMPRVGRVHVP
jgi:hypothetical protein